MKSPSELAQRARELAGEVQADLTFIPRDGQGFGGLWNSTSDDLQPVIIAKAASVLGFLDEYAGSSSEWFNRARIAWESKGDNKS